MINIWLTEISSPAVARKFCALTEDAESDRFRLSEPWHVGIGEFG
jgi:hypothetical protein